MTTTIAPPAPPLRPLHESVRSSTSINRTGDRATMRIQTTRLAIAQTGFEQLAFDFASTDVQMPVSPERGSVRMARRRPGAGR